MRKLIHKALVLLLLCLVIPAACLAGCGTPIGAVDLTEHLTPANLAEEQELPKDWPVSLTDFSVRLLQQAVTEEPDGNLLLSPLSVMTALTMVANGAEGETLGQMEQVLGAPISDLDPVLSAYLMGPSSGSDGTVTVADSIWIREDGNLSVREEFLQNNVDFFDASIFSAPFDNSTVKAINQWTKVNTDGQIDQILEEIPEEAVMYLINTVSFDAKWRDIYYRNQVRDGSFTLEDGSTTDVSMMYCNLGHCLQDDHAVGFLKYYEGMDYAFAALLPDEDISIDDYVASLTGEKLHQVLSEASGIEVHSALPKFDSAYETELSGNLQDLGMMDAFHADLADFSGIGACEDGNLFISRVLHKACISVTENGTKAAAATKAEVAVGSAMPSEEVYVYLNRPFVYAIVDMETKVPIFLGIMRNPNAG